MEAMRLASQGVSEPALGELSLAHVQICPQNLGIVDEELIEALQAKYPLTQFRLHANVRVFSQRMVLDLSEFNEHSLYWMRLRDLSWACKAPAYTAHAGRRANCDLNQVLNNTRRAEDFFGHPVGIEGHYPAPKDSWLISSFEEYEVMLKSGVRYALDLSHLNIVFKRAPGYRLGLVHDLLSSDQCIEVHLSGNDGSADRHEILHELPWWGEYLHCINPNAIVFSEGTQLR